MNCGIFDKRRSKQGSQDGNKEYGNPGRQRHGRSAEVWTSLVQSPSSDGGFLKTSKRCKKTC